MKINLKAILITLGIIIWLIVIFFVYASKYSSEAKHFSSYSKANYEDYEDSYFRNVKSKLTLILLNDDIVFGYYGDSINNGKFVSVSETDMLIQDAWKIFSKDSLLVFIKPTWVANLNATNDILDKMSANQVKNYTFTLPNKAEKEFVKLTDRIKDLKAGKEKQFIDSLLNKDL